MQEIIDYDLFQKMKALDNRQDLDGNDFGYQTCCDYFDSLVQDGEKFGAVMFVEPCGNITKWGNSWNEVLDWWIEVFKRQPENWQYIESGWYLMSMSEKGFSDDPTKVFPLTVEAREILKTMEEDTPPIPAFLDNKIIEPVCPICKNYMLEDDGLWSCINEKCEKYK